MLSNFLRRQGIFECLDKSDHTSYHVIMIILKFHRINVSGCCEKLVNFHVIGRPHVPEKSHPQYQKQIFTLWCLINVGV